MRCACKDHAWTSCGHVLCVLHCDVCGCVSGLWCAGSAPPRATPSARAMECALLATRVPRAAPLPHRRPVHLESTVLALLRPAQTVPQVCVGLCVGSLHVQTAFLCASLRAGAETQSIRHPAPYASPAPSPLCRQVWWHDCPELHRLLWGLRRWVHVQLRVHHGHCHCLCGGPVQPCRGLCVLHMRPREVWGPGGPNN